MSNDYFKEYPDRKKHNVGLPTKDEIKEFLESSKKVEEHVKEWDLSPYEEYLADLYFFVGKYFGWSEQEFENTPIDKILYYRDRILESLERNADSEDTKALPINFEHYALLFTMAKVFGGSKKNSYN